MKFGQFEIIRWHPSQTPAQSIEAVMEKIELGDTLGIDEIWIGEHHFPRHGLVSGIFSMLGSVAQRTKNARIGSAIVVLPWRSPIQVAEEAATIDILSGGRLTLGVGAGYQALEFNGMGADITEARARFREYVDVIYGCWRDEPLTFKGTFIDVEDLNVLPKPVQKPIPMHIAVSTSPESVDFAASKAMPIMVGGPTARNRPNPASDRDVARTHGALRPPPRTYRSRRRSGHLCGADDGGSGARHRRARG